MQVLTKKAIKRLLQTTKHLLTVDDFDIIGELDELAGEVAHVSKSHRRLLREPFELCGILFYPLTVAKSLWFNEKIEEWGIPALHHEAFLFWLMSLPNKSEIFDEYSDLRKAEKAIKRLSRKLHCSPDEITSIYHKCIGNSSGGDDGRDVDYGGMIAVLLKEYGGTPDQWLSEEPIDRISDLLRAYSESVRAQNGDSKAVDPNLIQSLSKFREKQNEIEALWSNNG